MLSDAGMSAVVSLGVGLVTPGAVLLFNGGSVTNSKLEVSGKKWLLHIVICIAAATVRGGRKEIELSHKQQ